MRSDAELLADIRTNIELARQFTAGLTPDGFSAAPMALCATTRCLEIISEASRNLSSDIKQRHPQIRWSQIAGAGNIYRHDYERVTADVIWKTVHGALPALLDTVMSELSSAA